MARGAVRLPLRPVRSAALLFAVATVTALSLSDRTFPVVRRIVSLTLAVVTPALRRVSDLLHLDPIVGGRPSTGPPLAWDTIGHFAAWMIIGLLAGLLPGRALERVRTAIGLFALSAAVEVGQAHLSFSRSAEMTDLLANGAGLAVGITIGAVLLGVASLAVDLVRGGTHRHRLA